MHNSFKYLIPLLVCFCIAFTSPLKANCKQDCILEVAASQVGVMELTGNNDGVEVERYLASVGLGKGYAWCAAFVSWIYQECDANIVKSAWSPSFFPISKIVYKRGNKNNQQPIPSDVFGLYFQNRGRIAHVGIIEKWSDKYAITIEGNTSNANSGETTREGDGVYRKRRLKRTIYAVSRWI